MPIIKSLMTEALPLFMPFKSPNVLLTSILQVTKTGDNETVEGPLSLQWTRYNLWMSGAGQGKLKIPLGLMLFKLHFLSCK